ncbi:MAG TPA: hypothetical protein IGS17_01805 [Oscillatoriales cyanobacterium M59_W2019_021]|nr:MAG: hypothetical protein D6728_06290 [Cyanobacteria bacterium J055]HIK31730.1 hypothetical protein [Oscillatoriales cyanobacterium M4454_W2019_049]HIK49649.1 hypothetical protein [Oscillatoriales cyanobacterium M59_W2019_021]
MTNTKIAIGTTLALTPSVATTAASAVGIAQTGTAIGSLHGAAHIAATTAWVGFSSTQVGMFLLATCPIVGALLVMDGIVESVRKPPQNGNKPIDRQTADIFNENLRQAKIDRANRERIEFWRSRGIEVK